MAQIGWLKLHRSVKEHWLYPARRKFTEYEAWLDLLIRANFSESKIFDNGRLIMVKRGDLLTSQQKLGFEWLWDRNSVRRFLNLLQSDGMIIQKSAQKFTIITICNYDSYQSDLPSNEHQTNIKRTSNEHQTNTLEEGKEGEEGEEYKEYLEGFGQEFLEIWMEWVQYRKEKKKKLTPATIRKQLKFLRKFDESTAREIIDISIKNGWTGLFEIKNHSNGNTQFKHSNSREAGFNAVLEDLRRDLVKLGGKADTGIV